MGQQKPVAPSVTPLSGKRAQRLIGELYATAQKMGEDGTSIGDLKIASAALAEMRHAFRMFSIYHHVRKVSAFGSARTREGDATFQVAEKFARSIADAGFMVITGAGGGIMEACQRGAGRERSFGINVELPFEQSANQVIHGDEKLMSFRYFFTRKLFFIKEADAVILFPGGFGTHDEGFEVLTLLQTGKCQPMPLVLLDKPRGTYWKTWNRYVEDHLLRRGLISTEDLSLYRCTDSVDTAVDEITRFYRVFHSARYVRDTLVLRTNHELDESFVADLAEEFADIVRKPGIEQRKAFPVERDDPDIWHLPRLALRFNRTNFGRLRQLIDRLNGASRE
jgi:uncharacterized protein (TIGR00730 family)